MTGNNDINYPDMPDPEFGIDPREIYFDPYVIEQILGKYSEELKRAMEDDEEWHRQVESDLSYIRSVASRICDGWERAILACNIAGMSCRAIGRLAGRSKDTIRRKLQGAIKKIRDEIKRNRHQGTSGYQCDGTGRPDM